MFEALAEINTAPPPAIVVQVRGKKRKAGSRSRRKGWVGLAVVVGAWVVLKDGSSCKVSAVLPDGRVYCSEVRQ